MSAARKERDLYSHDAVSQDEAHAAHGSVFELVNHDFSSFDATLFVIEAHGGDGAGGCLEDGVIAKAAYARCTSGKAAAEALTNRLDGASCDGVRGARYEIEISLFRQELRYGVIAIINAKACRTHGDVLLIEADALEPRKEALAPVRAKRAVSTCRIDVGNAAFGCAT